MAAGAISFLALGVACAEGTSPNEQNADHLTETMAGTDAGGTDSGTAGTSSAGNTSMPMAGMSSTGGSAVGGAGGTQTSAGTSSLGGMAGASGGVGGSSGGVGGMAGSGGAGGSAAGSGGSGGSGGAAPVGFRYAKLVATSEQNGKVWSSVAELQIMTTGNVAISRTNWTVTADSQEIDDQPAPATAAIDGDNATFWHTSWEPAPDDVSDAPLPHSLIVDLKTTQPITGFSYLPRQSGPNGRIKDWQFFVSKDGTTWGTAVKTGTFPNVATLQTLTF